MDGKRRSLVVSLTAGTGAWAGAGGEVPLALQDGQVPSGFMQAVAQFHTARLCGMEPQKLLPAQEHSNLASGPLHTLSPSLQLHTLHRLLAMARCDKASVRATGLP